MPYIWWSSSEIFIIELNGMPEDLFKSSITTLLAFFASSSLRSLRSNIFEAMASRSRSVTFSGKFDSNSLGIFVLVIFAKVHRTHFRASLAASGSRNSFEKLPRQL